MFWSATDHQTIQGLCNEEWFLSLVVNKHHEALMRLDQFHPAHLYIEDAVWELNYLVEDEEKESWKKEFKEKVKVNEFINNSKMLPLIDYEELEAWEEELCGF